MNKLKIVIALLLVIILGLIAWILKLNFNANSTKIMVQSELCVLSPVEFGIWQGELFVSQADLVSAQELMERNVQRLTRNFIAKGMPAESIVFSTTQVEESLDSLTNLQLKKAFTLTSSDLTRLNKVAQESTELLKFGVTISSNDVQWVLGDYLFVLINELPDLVANAREQAEQIAGADNKSIVGLYRFKLKPISQKSFEPCIQTKTSDFTTISIRLQADVEFNAR